MLMGGFQEVEITQEHKDIVKKNSKAICQKMNVNDVPEFTIHKVFMQVVGGLFFWFHL
jgi:hypothetical protein